MSTLLNKLNNIDGWFVSVIGTIGILAGAYLIKSDPNELIGYGEIAISVACLSYGIKKIKKPYLK